MRLHEFKQRVVSAFGPNLEHATPANVREFLDALNLEEWKMERLDNLTRGESRYHIDDCSLKLPSYEAIMRGFFVRALHSDNDRALVLLWTLALELAYSGIEEVESARFSLLFDSKELDAE